MPYTNVWTNTWAGSNAANQIDDRISQALVDIEQRMNNVLGNTAWSAGTDPTIDGTTLKSILTLTSEMATKPSINATDNKIPVRTAAGVLSDSDLSQATTGQLRLLTKYLTLDAQPRCVVFYSGNTGAITGNIPFDNELVDVGGLHDPVTNNSRITIPANAGGLYLFLALLAPNGTSQWNSHQIRFRKNAVTNSPVSVSPPSGASSPESMLLVFPIVCAAADYVEVQIVSGGAIDFASPYFCAIKVA